MTSGILKLALEEAESSSNYPYRIGAVIFKGSRIISSGHNQIRSNSISKKYKIFEESLHAEQDALLGIDWLKLKGCSICVVRLNYSGSLSMGKPCNMCYSALKFVGIKKIYYSNYNGEIVCEKMK